MRAWGRVAVLVAVVLASCGGLAGAASVYPSGRTDHRVPPKPVHLVSDRGADCRFTTVTLHGSGRHHGRPPTTTTTTVAPSASANLSVEIPPVVLIHQRGRELEVFTNTGSRPQVGDEFYAVEGKRSTPADAVLVREVLQRCSATGRPPGPSPR